MCIEDGAVEGGQGVAQCESELSIFTKSVCVFVLALTVWVLSLLLCPSCSLSYLFSEDPFFALSLCFCNLISGDRYRR